MSIEIVPSLSGGRVGEVALSWALDRPDPSRKWSHVARRGIWKHVVGCLDMGALFSPKRLPSVAPGKVASHTYRARLQW